VQRAEMSIEYPVSIMDKVIVVVGDSDLTSPYFRPFETFAAHGDCRLLFCNPEQVLLAVFTGGEDVDPSMYGEERNSKTCSNIARDLEEARCFNRVASHKIPMVGICRGSQFLCAMNGGKLVQHALGHGVDHAIWTPQGVVTVSSTHHQIAMPPRDAKIVAWAEPKLSCHYEGAAGVELFPECECEGVFYPETRSLGMQWHPEWMAAESDGYQFTQSLIHELLTDGRFH